MFEQISWRLDHHRDSDASGSQSTGSWSRPRSRRVLTMAIALLYRHSFFGMRFNLFGRFNSPDDSIFDSVYPFIALKFYLRDDKILLILSPNNSSNFFWEKKYMYLHVNLFICGIKIKKKIIWKRDLLNVKPRFLLNCNRKLIPTTAASRRTASERKSLTKERRFRYRVTHRRLAARTWRVRPRARVHPTLFTRDSKRAIECQ